MEYRLLEMIPKDKLVIKGLLLLYKEIFQSTSLSLFGSFI